MSGVLRIVLTLVVAATSFLVAPGTSHAQIAPANYAIEFVEPLTGDVSTIVTGISSTGWVSGTSSNADGSKTRAILYRDGKSRGRSKGLTRSKGEGVSTTAQVVGSYFVYPKITAAVWEGSDRIDLPSLGWDVSIAYDINDDGIVVGTSQEKEKGPYKACKWVDGKASKLETPGEQSTASAINNAGQIVGGTQVDSLFTIAALWDGDELTLLGTLGGENSYANAINESGQIVGDSLFFGGVALGNEGTHGFFWDDGVMTDLGTLPGGVFSLAADINNHGFVAGTSQNPDQSLGGDRTRVAVLWANGEIINLNDRVLDLQGWTLISAVGVNDDGQIVGIASNGEVTRGYVLTPIAE